MEYLKLMTILLLTFGLFNSALSKPSYSSTNPNNEEDNYDELQADDDYSYDDEDPDKSAARNDPIEDNDTTNEDDPYFEISHTSEIVEEGNDIVLFCDVKNFKKDIVIIWYNGTQLITQNKFNIKNNPRLFILDNHAIKINNVELSDSNEYACEVLPKKIRKTVTLNVTERPRAMILLNGQDASERAITFDQGAHVEFECKTFGVKNPIIKWSFNGERAEMHVSRIESDGKLIIDNIDSHQAGTYQCLGDDNSSAPPHGIVTVRVRFAPKVSTHRHYVNTDNGDEAELYCDYHAEPIGVAQWKKNGQRLTPKSDKYLIVNKMHNHLNRTILFVRNVDQNDIGEYECEVKNDHGKGFTKIHLIYEPETPQFENMEAVGNKVSLFWLIRSKQELIEATLEYKINGSVNWMSRPPISSGRHKEHTNVWKIRHELELQSGTWHAQVRTKNTAGWSKFSKEHTFTINEHFEDNSIPQDIVYSAGMDGGNSGTSASLILLPFIFTISLLSSFCLVPSLRNI